MEAWKDERMGQRGKVREGFSQGSSSTETQTTSEFFSGHQKYNF
jgi:hypothetical protein